MPQRDWIHAREVREKQIREQRMRDRQKSGNLSKSEDQIRREARKQAENECRVASQTKQVK